MSENPITSDAFGNGWLERKRRWEQLRQISLFPTLLQIVRGFGPIESALDAGCGDGASTETLIKAGVTRIEAWDVNPFLLEIARRHYGQRVEFGLRDLSKSRVEGTKFQLIMCCSVLMFIPHRAVETVFRNLKASLADDGNFLLSLVHPGWTLHANEADRRDRAPLRQDKLHEFPIGWEGVDGLLFYRPIAWYAERAKNAGFEVKVSRDIGVPPSVSDLPGRFEGEAGQPVFHLMLLQKA